MDSKAKNLTMHKPKTWPDAHLHLLGLSSFLLASKWSPIWQGLKSFFHATDEGRVVSKALGEWPMALARLVYIFLRNNPEYKTVFFWLLAFLLLLAIAHFLSLRLGPDDKKKAVRWMMVSSAGFATACLVYLFGVDSTIKANPLLQTAREYNVIVDVKYFGCGNVYGTYDASSEILTICNSAHTGKSTFESRESTIRHEIWHVIQACNGFNQTREKGNVIPVRSSTLFSYELPDDLAGFVNQYPVEVREIEEEAVRAETFLSDYLIEAELRSHCALSASPTQSG